MASQAPASSSRALHFLSALSVMNRNALTPQDKIYGKFQPPADVIDLDRVVVPAVSVLGLRPAAPASAPALRARRRGVDFGENCVVAEKRGRRRL